MECIKYISAWLITRHLCSPHGHGVYDIEHSLEVWLGAGVLGPPVVAHQLHGEGVGGRGEGLQHQPPVLPLAPPPLYLRPQPRQLGRLLAGVGHQHAPGPAVLRHLEPCKELNCEGKL